MLVGQLGLVVAAVFAGAAIYITVAEQPARLTLDDAALLAEWKPAYKRGFALQAPLAVLGFLSGIAAWLESGEVAWLIGALLMIANWPWTLLAIMPVNNRLMAMDLATAGAESRLLIERWGSLHTVRSALGAAAVVSFLVASLD